MEYIGVKNVETHEIKTVSDIDDFIFENEPYYVSDK